MQDRPDRVPRAERHGLKRRRRVAALPCAPTSHVMDPSVRQPPEPFDDECLHAPRARNFENCEAESRRRLDGYRSANIGLAQKADAI
jgi:hypothetical protein